MDKSVPLPSMSTDFVRRAAWYPKVLPEDLHPEGLCIQIHGHLRIGFRFGRVDIRPDTGVSEHLRGQVPRAGKVRATYVCSAEICPAAKFGLAKICAGQYGAFKVRVLQLGKPKIGYPAPITLPFQGTAIRLAGVECSSIFFYKESWRRKVRKLGSAQIGTAQIGAGEVSPVKLRLRHLRAREIATR